MLSQSRNSNIQAVWLPHFSLGSMTPTDVLHSHPMDLDSEREPPDMPHIPSILGKYDTCTIDVYIVNSSKFAIDATNLIL